MAKSEFEKAFDSQLRIRCRAFYKAFKNTQKAFFNGMSSETSFEFEDDTYHIFDNQDYNKSSNEYLDEYLALLFKPKPTVKVNPEKTYYCLISDNDKPSQFGYDEHGAIIYE